ncbi:MAG: 50S ribosomal protein L2 [Patescibacteria group bacterium]
MPIKTYKPVTPSRRYITTVDFSMLTKKEPEKGLIVALQKHSGRNHRGKITVRHRGGASKRQYRMIDFRRSNYDVEGEVKSLEYDPNRSAFVALVQYSDGTKSYILAQENLKVGDKVKSSLKKLEANIGNRYPLKYIPTGTFVSEVEFAPNKGGQMVRSAGSAAQLLAIEGKFAQLKFPSGEVRNILIDSCATVGRVSNIDHGNVMIGSAGRSRKMGRRPEVRGKAMNPKDHPHGGGEGRNSIGMIHPKTRWGKPAFGVKTRKPHKLSDKLILRRRK